MKKEEEIKKDDGKRNRKNRITNERTLVDLEFDKLKEIVQGFASSPLGKGDIAGLKPSKDRKFIEKELQRVRECMDLLRKRDPLKLGEMHDLRPFIKVAKEHPPLNPEDFLQISTTVKSASEIKEYVMESDDETHRIQKITAQIADCRELIRETTDKLDRRGGIRDDATEKLRKLIKEKAKKEKNVKEELNSFLDNNPSLIQERIVARRSNRLVVPLKSSAKSRTSCVVHESSNSGQTLFAEPKSVVELNNSIRDLSSEIRQEKNKVLRELTDLVKKNDRKLLRTQEALKKIDSLTARAKYSLEYSCTVPKIAENEIVDLIDARHPLLDRDEVVPVTIGFGSSYRGATITGPNTGGKTVTLKTIGLFSLMNQAGIPIPASRDSRLGIFEGVYSDIGDEQSIEQSLSTFSSHMENIVDILEEIDENSLVLLDELGAGTDPQEGAALGLSLLEHILGTGAAVVVTTHFTALKKVSVNHPNLATFSVDFDPGKLEPTFHILEGVPGKSNALIVGSELGLSDSIIKEAKEFLQESEIKAEDIIDELAKEKRKVREKLKKIKEEKRQLEKKKEEYQQKIEKYKEDKKSSLNEKLKEIDKFITLAKKDVEQAINKAKEGSLEEARNQLENIKKVERKKEKAQKALKETENERTLSLDNIDENQKVWVKSASQQGTVDKIKNENSISVRVGGMTLDTKISDLELPKGKSESKEGGTSAEFDSKKGAAELEINVRGLKEKEALWEVDRYIDRLLRADRDQGRILHGKGTGKLRKSIRGHLREMSWVKRCYAPPRSEGGEGVTVFEMKDK